MKKIISMIIIALISATMLGCNKSTLTVGILIYDGSDTFMCELVNKIQNNSIGLDINFEIRDGENSQSIQNKQIIDLLDDNVSMLIINAVDRQACSAIIEKSQKKNLPIVFINREPLIGDMSYEKAYYVGAEVDSLGQKQADMVADLVGENFLGSIYDKNNDGVIQLVVLKGEQGHQDAEKRTVNCIERLRERFGKDAVVNLATKNADWRRDKGYEVMEQLYEEFDNIELVFSNNDDMALGAIDYMKEIGQFEKNTQSFNQPIIIVGVDGTEDGLNAIEQGFMYGTVLNDSSNQARACLEIARCVLFDKNWDNFTFKWTNQKYIYIDGEIILRADLDKYR